MYHSILTSNPWHWLFGLLVFSASPACGGGGSATADQDHGPDGGTGGSNGGDGDGTPSGDGDSGPETGGNDGTGTGGDSSPGTGGGGAGGAPPSNFPLLVVATDSGVSVWENADDVSTGAGPDFSIKVPGELIGVVESGRRLGALSSEGLYLFDDLGSLSASSTPSGSIAASAFDEDLSPSQDALAVDAEGDLWATFGLGRIALFEEFATLTSSSTPKAVFTHPWEQLVSASYDGGTGTLYCTQISGAGVQYYSGAKEQSGVVGSSGTFANVASSGSAMLGNRLVTAGTADGELSNQLFLWEEPTPAGSSVSPTLTMAPSGASLAARGNAIVTASDEALHYYAPADALTVSSSPRTLDLELYPNALGLSEDAGTVLISSWVGEVFVARPTPSGLVLEARLPAAGSVDVVWVE